MKNRITLLVTSAGRRAELLGCFRSSARKLGVTLEVLAADMAPRLSAACRLSDRSFEVPSAKDPSYIPLLLALCQEHEVDVVIPTIDPELLPLSQARKEFERLHVYLLSRIRSRFPSPATSASSRSACSPPAFWRPGRRR